MRLKIFPRETVRGEKSINRKKFKASIYLKEILLAMSIDSVSGTHIHLQATAAHICMEFIHTHGSLIGMWRHDIYENLAEMSNLTLAG